MAGRRERKEDHEFVHFKYPGIFFVEEKQSDSWNGYGWRARNSSLDN